MKPALTLEAFADCNRTARRRVAPKHLSMVERLDFHSMPEPNTGCVIWLGATDRNGYGFTTRDKRQVRAHRASYECNRGPIPDGLVLDHLCRTPSCINPQHLEAVSAQVNTMRGYACTAVNARKTHCIHGHLLAGDNLMPPRHGWRICRACRNAARDRRTPVPTHLRDYKAEYAKRLAARLRTALSEAVQP